MTLEEARTLLGLDLKASRKEIRAAIAERRGAGIRPGPGLPGSRIPPTHAAG